MKINKKSVGRVIAMKPLRDILEKLKGKSAALAKESTVLQRKTASKHSDR